MSDDKLTDIFKDITPEMFAIETSTTHEEHGHFVGLPAFNAFVDENIRAVRMTFGAGGNDQFHPVAVLVAPGIRRHFAVEPDENLGMFLERLKREAVLLGAQWLFLAKKNVFAVWHEDLDDEDDRADAASPDAATRAVRAGAEQQVGILWYAERREGDETHHRHGAIEINDGKLGSLTEGDDKQAFGVFSLILDEVRR